MRYIWFLQPSTLLLLVFSVLITVARIRWTFSVFLTAISDCYNDETPTIVLPRTGEKVTFQCLGFWTPILFTNGGSDFDRPYSNYTRGFGSIQHGNYWLGNEIMAYLTALRPYNLRVDLWYSDGTFKYAEFKRISLLDLTQGFQLQLHQFLGGSAGDGGLKSGATFHAKDLDNLEGCAAKLGSGWWYGNGTLQDCMRTKLTGKNESTEPGHGIYWGSGDPGPSLMPSLVQATMRVRPELSSSKGKTLKNNKH